MALTTVNSVAKQNSFVSRLEADGFDYGIVVGQAFVSGMRDIGYKSTGSAIDELIDNSIESGADSIAVIFGYDPRSDKKPARIAIVDNGHGMAPSMIRLAVLWGGTHRQNSRELFGRYGFGLPSACVSIGRRFEVYSRTSGDGWNFVPMDLDLMAAGDPLYVQNQRLHAPPARPASPPAWVVTGAAAAKFPSDLLHGTVVVIDNLDRIDHKTTRSLEDSLIHHFGLVYRNHLGRHRLWVNGTPVEPVDPLFIDPAARYHTVPENALRAVELPSLDVDVRERDARGNRGPVLGRVRVRFAYLPPGFQNVGGCAGRAGKLIKGRFQVMKDNNGILVLRAGRQIDVVSTKCPWITFMNNDRNWKCEIDFPPALDEQFSITTSKQQVVLTERMWELLKDAGVLRSIEGLRSRYRAELPVKEGEEETAEGPSTSEEVMEIAQRFRTRQPVPSPETLKRGEEGLSEAVKERVRLTGRPEVEVRGELEGELAAWPYKRVFTDVREGPFYMPEAVGAQVRVQINRQHPFFTEVYRGDQTTPALRSALDLLLFVLSECELQAAGDRRLFYENDRREWSSRLSTALSLLSRHAPERDPEDNSGLS